MKKKMNKILNYIDDIKEWKWIIITFIICLIFYLSFSIDIIWRPYIFAEDGGIFLSDALNDRWKSLYNSYGGYISIVPRIITLISVFVGVKLNSLYIIVLMMKWLSIIFATICANYLNSDDFKDIFKNRALRLLICLMLIAVMANQNFVIYNVTYTHWWCGMLAFLCSISLINKRIPKTYIIPILFMSILTSPSALIIAIPLMYYVVSMIREIKTDKKNDNSRKIDKMKIVIIIILIIAIALQAFKILNINHRIHSTDVDNSNILFLSSKIIVTFFTNTTSLLSFQFSENLPTFVDALIGLLIWYIILECNLKNQNIKMLILCVLEIVCLLFMNMYKNDTACLLPYVWIEWYNSVPFCICTFLIAKTIYDECKVDNRILHYSAGLLFVIYFIVLYENTYQVDFKLCKNITDIEPKVNFESNYMVEVPIPGGFNPKIPINKEIEE